MRPRAIVLAAALVLVGAGCGGSDHSPRPPAADPGSSAASDAGVRSAVCSDVHFRGSGRPRLLIVSTFPMQGGFRSETLQAVEAIRMVFEQRRFRAGRYTVGFQACDDSTVEAGISDAKRCAANARAFARTRRVAAVIGPFFSSCAAELLPVINRLTQGELAVISPSNSYVGLTHAGDGAAKGEPDRFYPTGTRDFVRLAAADDVQGAADALTAKRAGVRRAYVLHDGSLYGKGLADAFTAAAAASGLSVAAVRAWDPKAKSYKSLVAGVARAGADGVFLGGLLFSNGARLIRDLRARLGARLPIVTPDGFGPPAALIQRAGDAAEGVYISKPDIPRETLGAAGRRFYDQVRDRTGKSPCCYTMHTAQAAELVLDAIAASDGTRASVSRALRGARVHDGLIGSFAFDRYGDTTLRRIFMHRIEGGEMRFVATVTPSPSQIGG